MLFLSSDIGGTNARFALFEKNNENFELIELLWLKSGEFSSIDEMLQELAKKSENFALKNIKACAFAVAGPVENKKYSKISKLAFVLDIEKIRKNNPKFPPSVVVNDFEAQAMACTLPIAKNFIELTSHNNSDFFQNLEENFPILAVGAGTGYGTALLTKQNNSYQVVPSEMGHQSFPFLADDEFEREFSNFYLEKRKQRYVSVENILSGAGLEFLHSFIHKENLKAHEIPNSSEAFYYFAKYLGRIIRNSSYSFMPKSIVITGGIGAKHEHIFNNVFFEEFLCAEQCSWIVENMPIYLNKDENLALHGATYFLKDEFLI